MVWTLPCPTGSYSSSEGAALANCTQCPAGSYSSSEGTATCTRCPTGMTTSSIGSTSSSACTVPICPVGYANVAIGKATQSSANPGVSTLNGTPSSFANDDSLSSGVFSHIQQDAWWLLDLGTNKIQVASVYIWQPTDSVNRNQNLEVRLGTQPAGYTWDNPLCYYQAKTWTQVDGINLTCSQPLVGPIVTIQGESANFSLSLLFSAYNYYNLQRMMFFCPQSDTSAALST